MQFSGKCYNIQAKLTQENVDAINELLAMDQRCEVIPTRDGVRVIRVRRDEYRPRSKR